MNRWMLASAVFLSACGGPDETSKGDSDTDVPAPECVISIEIEQCAPDFALPDPTGEILTLSGFRGQAVLVDFSALW